ncbi:MAG: nucleotidyltransferase family protein [Kiloniellales bacterium]
MKNFQDILIAPTTPILESIEKIDSGSVQIALVVDEGLHLLGTVTDGDVRRGILKGVPMSQPVSAIMNPTPVAVDNTIDRGAILQLMRQWEIAQVPIVDAEERVVGLETIADLTGATQADTWVVLMAGGLGQRLRPLTEDTPKPLLSVGGKPLLETIIESFARQGFQRIFLSVNYKADMFEAHFGDGADWGVSISYLNEDRRLGTAGALGLLPERPKDPLIVMNADVLTSVDFRHLLDFHDQHAADATMCVREYSFQVPYGVAKIENHHLRGISEKPKHQFFVNAGIYVLGPPALDLIPADESADMPNLFETLIAGGGAAAVFPIREYWLDIGRSDDLERAQGDYAREFA